MRPCDRANPKHIFCRAIDGSGSTLVPIFAAAGLTGKPENAFFVGLAASLGAGVSMGLAEALSDDGRVTGRGGPIMRGAIQQIDIRLADHSKTRSSNRRQSFPKGDILEKPVLDLRRIIVIGPPEEVRHIVPIFYGARSAPEAISATSHPPPRAR
jgi:hypothetical protein